MFRNSRGGRSTDSLLPTSGNGRGGGGGMYGGARSTRQSLSKSFIATIAWAVASIALIVGGFMYCSRKVESTNVKCDHKGCKVVQLKDGNIGILTIPRQHMVRADLVRVKSGDIVDPSTLRRSAQRKLGHSYALVYVEPDSVEDDDDSYDTFEDDDDSYDSYDDEEDSSADDDDMEDDDSSPVLIAGKGAGTPKKPATASGNNDDRVKTATSAKKFDNSKSPEERQADAKRREAQRQKYAEDRERRGLAPIKEPDEKRRMQADRAANQEWADNERFPGDAGTMLEKNREEIRRMSEQQGIAARQHKEKAQREHEEAAKRHNEKERIDAQTKQRGNNLHDRSASPDDPDSKRPELPRQEARRDLPRDGDAGGGAADAEERIKNLQAQLAELQGEAKAKSGGRSISSVGGLKYVDQQDLPQGEERFVENPEAGVGLEEPEYRKRGDLVQAGARGAQRKLLSWKDRVKKVDPPAPRRSKAEIAKAAARDREVHRKHHGHHHKMHKKEAKPGPEDPGRPQGDKTKHHHKAFHHKNDVPTEERHHLHPGFHHAEGEKKVGSGWRHQNRQWHDHAQLTRLGTTYNLGRSKARGRKELIDNYVFKRGPREGQHAVDFTDTKKWRAAGMWMMIVGFISMVFCFVVGNFRPRPKMKKVS